jgi:PAS domain S-box-containing protein
VKPASIPADDAERVAALHALGISRTGEDRFDRITRLTAASLRVPIAFVSLVDTDQQWFKSCIGIGAGPYDRDTSFCGHALLHDEPMVVEDARRDERFHDNPFVTGEPHIVFYVGRPLTDPQTGHRVGTLCAVDQEPRQLGGDERGLLDDLARLVESELHRGELSRLLEALDRSRQELREQKLRDELILASTEEAIIGIDVDGRVTFANAAGGEMLRVPADELVGRDFHVHHHSRHEDGTPVPWSACPTYQTLADGRSRRSTEEWVWRDDGTGFPAELSTTPIEVEGRITGAVNTIVDRSERRSIERLKQQFVSMVSHELRTPLTSVNGSLRMLAAGLAGDLPGEALELVQLAEANAGRLIRLVNDILDLERLRQGRIDLHREPVGAASVLRTAADTVAGMAHDADITLDVAAADLDGVVLDADPHRLGQAVTNLVGNAVKFSPEGATVWLRGEVDGGDVVLSVRDAGRGIPSEHLETIFEAFAQVEATDARIHGGSGLGLAIARQVVEAHGGTLTVDSQFGAGATFIIRLRAGARSEP